MFLQVLTAASGQEAIDIFRREQGSLDLILMDVQMPVRALGRVLGHSPL